MKCVYTALQAALVAVASAAVTDNSAADKCPGYKASNVKTSHNGLTADLKLAGKACNAFGDDLENLKLVVSYDTGTSITTPPSPVILFPAHKRHRH